MDVYSFGLLLIRLFLSGDLPNSIGEIGKHPGAKVDGVLLDRIDEMKKLSGDGFLHLIVQALEKSQIIEAQHKALLRRLFEMTLCLDAQNRASMREVATNLMQSETRSHSPSSADQIPSIAPLTGEACPHFLDVMHTVPSVSTISN
jgi:hypothetical protein